MCLILFLAHAKAKPFRDPNVDIFVDPLKEVKHSETLFSAVATLATGLP